MAFPITEPEIIALCNRMTYGYYRYAADFSHVPNIARIRLMTALRSYYLARKAMVKVFAALQIIKKAKNSSLQELKKIMKECLQKSEVDVASNPEKLKLIGWSPKGDYQPAQLPNQPINLQITAKENRIISLKWDRPEDNQRVRNYCIERRQENGEGFSDWTIVQISYKTEAILRNQPTGVQLEYPIRAANNAGTGPAGNTITVVL
jgi:hypothetical protein